MTNAFIRPATTDDIPALQIVLEPTGLFPAEILPQMLSAALEDEAQGLWLTCQQDGTAVGRGR